MMELTAKLRIVAMMPHLIILSATLFITSLFPGSGYLFGPGFGIRCFADIRMVFAGQSTIGGLDCLEIVRRFLAHDGVIILLFRSFISRKSTLIEGTPVR